MLLEPKTKRLLPATEKLQPELSHFRLQVKACEIERLDLFSQAVESQAVTNVMVTFWRGQSLPAKVITQHKPLSRWYRVASLPEGEDSISNYKAPRQRRCVSNVFSTSLLSFTLQQGLPKAPQQSLQLKWDPAMYLVEDSIPLKICFMLICTVKSQHAEKILLGAAPHV